MKRLVAAFFSMCFVLSPTLAATLEQDVDRYLEILSLDQDGEKLRALSWEGLSDPRLFDVIEKRIQDVSYGKPDSKSQVKRFGYYIRALGYSGQAKYISTLQSLKSHRYYDDYAENALRDQPLYQRWNPIISNRASFNPNLSDDANRLLNMLTSDDILLNRIACRRIYDGVGNQALFDALEKRVQATYMRTDLRGDYEDSAAWLVKALGSSKMEKYKPLLIDVATKSPMSDVVRHAKRTLERDYRLKNTDYIP